MYILRDGRVVGEMEKAEARPASIHALMVGRPLDDDYYGQTKRRTFSAEVALSVQNLSRPNEYDGVTFDLRKGEILGVCGVIGSGREAVLRSIAGLNPPQSGDAAVGGRRQPLSTPVRTVAGGIGYVPQERRVEGLVLPLPVTDNISLPSLPKFRKIGVIRPARQRETAWKWVKRLSIRPPNPALPAAALSGGNQQKVVLAKWIESGVRILLLDHPTRGIDVGAKQEVYSLIRELATAGMAVLLTADSLEEMLGLCDNILVMRDHRITARFSVHEDRPTQLDIIRSMV